MELALLNPDLPRMSVQILNHIREEAFRLNKIRIVENTRITEQIVYVMLVVRKVFADNCIR